MTDHTLLILLGVISGCLLAITVTAVLTAQEFRGTLRQLNRMLPDAGEALRDTRRSLRKVRRLLAGAGDAARHVETVVHHTCEVAADAVDHVAHLKGRAEDVAGHWMGLLGNGTGAEPRRHGPNGKKAKGRRQHRRS